MARGKTRTRTVYRSKRGRRRNKTTIPLAVIAGLLPTAAFTYETYKSQGITGGMKAATMRLTGYNAWVGNWYPQELAAGWVPILAGAFAHKAANRLGINRALSRMGVPLVRI